jgi:nuclear pore complex protein Nup155
MCAKSSAMHSGSASEGEFLHELEEKMEVARLQMQVLETLQKWTSDLPTVKDALSRLNSELLDITTVSIQ